MNLDKFLNLLAAIFGTLGAVYVMLSILAMSPDLMARQASTLFGFNPSQVEALAGQKGDNVAGVAFVIIAFALSAATLILAPDGFRVFERRSVALALAAVVAGGTYLTIRFIADGISREQKVKIVKVLTSEFLDEAFKHGRVEVSHKDSLEVHAHLLGLEYRPAEPVRSLLERVAAKVGKTLPPGLDYSAVEPKK